MTIVVGPQAQLPSPFSAVSFTWWMYGTGSLTAAAIGLGVNPTYFVATRLPDPALTVIRRVVGTSSSTRSLPSIDHVATFNPLREGSRLWRLPSISTDQEAPE